MTNKDWPAIKRLLVASWPESGNAPIDDSAWISLLAPYGPELVGQAIRGLLGEQLFMPKVSEVVKRVRLLSPSVDGSTRALIEERKRARDEDDRLWTARKDRELEREAA